MRAPKTITIDNIEYVRKTDQLEKAESMDGLVYAIVRTRSAGVFAGFIKERKGQELTLLNARRLWQWAGAASLSQLAMEGTSNPNSCKFPMEVSKIELFEVIEILETTKKAKESIDKVAVWKN